MNYAKRTDAELVRLCLEGRERAALELVTRFERPVFSLIHRMVRDRELAEDLAQDAFVRAFDHLDRYDPSYKFSSWLFKIAHNLTIDHLRRRDLDTVSIHGAPDATTPEAREATSITLESREEAPDRRLEAKETGAAIEEAIGRLRPAYREAVLLRHVEGCSYREIADIMDVPLGTVKTHIHRARQELQEMLEPLREP